MAGLYQSKRVGVSPEREARRRGPNNRSPLTVHPSLRSLLQVGKETFQPTMRLLQVYNMLIPCITR